MAHVNLLPWREKQRQHQKQQYLAGLLAVAAIVGLIFGSLVKLSTSKSVIKTRVINTLNGKSRF